MNLFYHINNLKILSQDQKKLLEKKKFETAWDVLKHLPATYEDRRLIHSIASIQSTGSYQIKAQIIQKNFIVSKKMLKLDLEDETGVLRVMFFNCKHYMAQQFSTGQKVRCYGKFDALRHNMVQPKISFISDTKKLAQTERVIPIYHYIPLQTKKWQSLVMHLLDNLEINDLFHTLDSSQSYNFKDALFLLHAHTQADLTEETLHQAKESLAFYEITTQIAARKLIKKTIRNTQSTPIISHKNAQEAASLIKQQLPFSLSHSQQKSWKALTYDLGKPVPMTRLLQGDVGSGKTVLIALSALSTALSGQHTLIMAPTSILAQQHFKHIKSWCRESKVDIFMLSGQSTPSQKKQIVERLLSSQACILICTHAIFYLEIKGASLGLLVFDEQHKFGVKQRINLLKQSKSIPHQLMVSATPIPRSLLMTFYGDLDVTVLHTFKEKTNIQTRLITQERMDELIIRIKTHCQNKQEQAYWVCPWIERKEETLEKDFFLYATEILPYIQSRHPDLRIELLHGQMNTQEKANIMQKFLAHEIDLLVTTSVIEVGISIENANIMTIIAPEKFGLAQLHQIRGRVGRSQAPGYCMLLHSNLLNPDSLKRLDDFQNTSSGFDIAEQDLKQRGSGALFSTLQSGGAQTYFFNFYEHKEFLKAANITAEKLVNEEQKLKAALNIWIQDKIDLALS